MPDWLERFLTAFFVAGLTAFVTVHLALRRFHAERWWERKAAAYDRLLGSLADLQRYVDQRVEELEGTKFAADYVEAINEKYRDASHELECAGILGSYAFSDRTARALAKLLAAKNARLTDNPHDFFLRAAEAYSRAITEITASAKEDLRVDEEFGL